MGTQYATLTDMQNLGFPPTAFGQLGTPAINAQLQAASDWATSKMAARYSLPLLAWDTSITQGVVHIAAYQCLVLRGFDPSNPGDAAARDLWIAAREFFDAIERQHAHPLVTESPAPTQQVTPQYAAPLVAGMPLQGWLPGQDVQSQQGIVGQAPSGWPAGWPWPSCGGGNTPGVF